MKGRNKKRERERERERENEELRGGENESQRTSKDPESDIPGRGEVRSNNWSCRPVIQ